MLAHEIGHVANGDMVTLSLVQGVVNTFVMFFARIAASVVDNFLSSDEEGESSGGGIGYFVTVIVFEILFGILASIVVSWFSRYREYRADEAGADLSSNHAMIGALQRLKAEYEMPDQMPDQMLAFGISSHLKDGFMSLLASHHRWTSVSQRCRHAAKRHNRTSYQKGPESQAPFLLRLHPISDE